MNLLVFYNQIKLLKFFWEGVYQRGYKTRMIHLQKGFLNSFEIEFTINFEKIFKFI